MASGIRATYIEPNRFAVGWRMARHRHAEWNELQLVLRGRLATDFSGRTLIAGPGTAVLHPAGEDHAEAVLGGEPVRTLFAGWVGGPTPRSLIVHDRQGRIEATLTWAAEAFARGTVEGRACAEALLLALLHEIDAVVVGRHDDLVRRAAAYARANLRSPLRLPDLARAAGASRAHFARAFRTATGDTAMRFVRRLRIDAAKRLLATTDLTVAAIAERVGFSDRFHFSRAFSRECGRPPGRGRR